ncbi:class Ib ribonucleoside-diphosphate reductase assembly flavoprotein NrdI [Sphingobacterium siyangense]|uniref:class Ib ribonucleoside-diphosphate reductase assembly flavoprotein NrdI n=1 Tax=Sphingobacterium siyangense TaxID=459529 RepID=UPI00289EFC10|nr:class Ib ribonucleoside-diphosphate reductase assembly flavoprotein NrdI [Sphingobacterium siyangense]
MIIIYYDSKTGNVQKFADKLLAEKPEWKIVDIRSGFIGAGHLITHTIARGAPPTTTLAFLKSFSPSILSVSVSGNRNWGIEFAGAAEIIANKFEIPILLKFELSGFPTDLKFFIEKLIKYEKDHLEI